MRQIGDGDVAQERRMVQIMAFVNRGAHVRVQRHIRRGDGGAGAGLLEPGSRAVSFWRHVDQCELMNELVRCVCLDLIRCRPVCPN